MKIIPNPGETPLEALLRQNADAGKVFEWDESDFVPATDAEMRTGLRDAMAVRRPTAEELGKMTDEELDAIQRCRLCLESYAGCVCREGRNRRRGE